MHKDKGKTVSQGNCVFAGKSTRNGATPNGARGHPVPPRVATGPSSEPGTLSKQHKAVWNTVMEQPLQPEAGPLNKVRQKLRNCLNIEAYFTSISEQI